MNRPELTHVPIVTHSSTRKTAEKSRTADGRNPGAPKWKRSLITLSCSFRKRDPSCTEVCGSTGVASAFFPDHTNDDASSKDGCIVDIPHSWRAVQLMGMPGSNRTWRFAQSYFTTSLISRTGLDRCACCTLSSSPLDRYVQRKTT